MIPPHQPISAFMGGAGKWRLQLKLHHDGWFIRLVVKMRSDLAHYESQLQIEFAHGNVALSRVGNDHLKALLPCEFNLPPLLLHAKPPAPKFGQNPRTHNVQAARPRLTA